MQSQLKEDILNQLREAEDLNELYYAGKGASVTKEIKSQNLKAGATVKVDKHDYTIIDTEVGITLLARKQTAGVYNLLSIDGNHMISIMATKDDLKRILDL